MYAASRNPPAPYEPFPEPSGAGEEGGGVGVGPEPGVGIGDTPSRRRDITITGEAPQTVEEARAILRAMRSSNRKSEYQTLHNPY